MRKASTEQIHGRTENRFKIRLNPKLHSYQKKYYSELIDKLDVDFAKRKRFTNRQVQNQHTNLYR